VGGKPIELVGSFLSAERSTESRWNPLGGRSDGAGGPDRTTRVYAFSLPLAARLGRRQELRTGDNLLGSALEV
jgi:hypothetical protein